MWTIDDSEEANGEEIVEENEEDHPRSLKELQDNTNLTSEIMFSLIYERKYI